jgi:hypothetical protein
MGEWKYRSTYLDLDNRRRWVVSYMTRPLYPLETALGTHLIGGWVDPRIWWNIPEANNMTDKKMRVACQLSVILFFPLLKVHIKIKRQKSSSRPQVTRRFFTEIIVSQPMRSCAWETRSILQRAMMPSTTKKQEVLERANRLLSFHGNFSFWYKYVERKL